MSADAAGGQPLHERIRADIGREILSGHWPPGHRIPVEHEFMAEYGCSRMTVNKAIAALVSAGLIVRRRRAGSFVARPRVHSAVLDIPDLESVIRGRGEQYQYELLSQDRRRVAAGETLGAQLGTTQKMLIMTCRHFADAQVFALEQRAINLAAVPEAGETDFRTVAPGAWLLRHVPWTEAEHRISALNVSAAEARLLKVKTGTACLVVERHTWRGGEGITHTRQVFPASMYDLVARFGHAP